jgi:hypothetical protein
LKSFTAIDQSAKGVEVWEPNWLKSRVKLKTIESLMVNWGVKLDKSEIKDQSEKALKSSVKIKVWQRQNCIKSKVLESIRGKIKGNQKPKDHIALWPKSLIQG